MTPATTRLPLSARFAAPIRARFPLLLMPLLAVVPSLAHAENVTFNGAPSTPDWFLPGNWIPNHVPTAADTVRIVSELHATIGAPGAVGKTLLIGANAAFSGYNQVTVENGGTLSLNSLIVGDDGRGRLVIQSGGQVTLTPTALNKDFIVSIGIQEGGIPNDSLISVSGANSKLTAAERLILGTVFNSNGAASVADGGELTVPQIRMAYYDDAQVVAKLDLLGTATGRGVVATQSIVSGTVSNATINFDGGILRATGNEPNFVRNFSNGEIRILGGGGYIDTQNFNVGISSPLTDVGQLTKQGSGKLTLSANNSYSGGTVIEAGTLELGHGAALGATGTITFAGGTLRYAGAVTTDYSARFSSDANQQYRIETSGPGVTLANPLTSPGGSLVKSGIGTLTLSGDNTYTGGTVVTGGVLAIGASERLPNSGSLTVQGGTFDLGASNETVGAVTLVGGSIKGTGTLVGSSYTVSEGTISATLGGSSGLTKTGTGIVRIDGSQTYTGTTTISGGTLMLGAGGLRPNALAGASVWLEAGTGVVTSSGNVTTWFDQSGNGHDFASGAGSTINVGTLTTGAPALTFNGSSFLEGQLWNGGSHSMFAVIQPSVVTNPRTILGSSDNGNAQFRINNGKIELLSQSVALLGSSTDSVTAGTPTLVAATLTNGAQSYYIGDGAANGSSSPFVPASAAGGLIGTNANKNESFSGGIGAVVVFDSVLTPVQIADVQRYLNFKFLGGSETGIDYSVIAPGSLPTNTPVSITAAGAVLDLNGTTQTIGSLSGVGGSQLNLAGGRLIVGTDNTSTIFAGNIASDIAGGGLTKTGTGKLTLSGTSTHAGGFIIESGTLGIGSNTALGAGQITINGGGIRAEGSPRTLANPVTINGNFTLGRLTNFTGPITLANSAKITSANPDSQGPNFTSVISGSISGSANGLTFDEGANPIGTIVLSGANDYSGGTILQSGTLSAANSQAFGSGVVSIQGGTLSIESTGDLTPGGSGGTLETGSFILGSSGTLKLELGGTAPGQFDQLSSTGIISLAGTAQISLFGGFTPVPGNKFFVLVNDGTDPVSGAFANADAFNRIAIAGAQFLVNYADNFGGTGVGNDVSLTMIAVPEPNSATLLAGAAVVLGLSRRRRMRRELGFEI